MNDLLRSPLPKTRPKVRRKLLHRLLLVTAVVAGSLVANGPATALPAAGMTAWQNGSFVVDRPNLVRRSDIILGRANPAPTESLPLGNGALGAAVWSAGGFTAQLNRTDTFPDRKSLGQVVIPGLSRMTSAADFTGRLDLYDGMLRQSGGGMTLTAFIRADTQQLVVDVTGADPNATQTAQVKLWSPRTPTARASGSVAALAETWVDNNGAGASGRTFGSLAGVTAGGRNVVGSTPNNLTAQVAFQPNTDGSFRVVVAAPTWTGGDSIATTNAVLNGAATRPANEVRDAHLQWWHDYWNQAGLIKISSADGTGDYVENLRTIFLYASAAQSRGVLPGSQAGVADLFTFSQDKRDWYPSGYWFWNLRMQVAANVSAGVPNLNDPMFRLYQDNVDAIAAWTSAHMPGRTGLCVPETMRFNGNGTYNGGTDNSSCDSTITPQWNSLNVTTGAEVGLWVWEHYRMTDDQAFLQSHYPLIKGAAQFLLSHATTGSDGKLHTRSNAHETQWDVTDPTTDIAAMQAFFPIAVKAAQLLNVDAALVSQLNAAIPKIQTLPRTDTATQTQLLTPANDAGGTTMIGPSTQPAAQRRNSENIGLEAVWPFNLIGDSGPMTALARRTYASRSYVNSNSWSYDSLHAARLGLPTEMKTALLAAIRQFQVYPSGMASFTAQPAQEPYIEQSGVLAATVPEALATDYDGVLRIAPSWPTDWSGEGTVAIGHKSRVHVQIAGGSPTTVAISSGANQQLAVRSPWPGQSVTVLDGQTRATVVGPQTNATFTIPAQSGKSYLVEKTGTAVQPFQALTGTPATAARRWDKATIGLPKATSGTGTISLKARANGRYVTAGTGTPLIADSTTNGTAQQYEMTDLGGGNVSLRAKANNLLVAADNAGAAPLLAKNQAVGSWETFQLIRNGDGSVSFRAAVNNKLVCADNAGAAPLIANRDAIGPWEQFDLINN
ncbi:glycoside hydrolase N-terminal domain-containing protein [Kribbella koreensis]|uniref:Glycoside hydrolase N-terminal domain-containing protein n=1 Tax=Kribbella koreensis TaxID=57909 RepID=A0ABN1RLF2_9ACTN